MVINRQYIPHNASTDRNQSETKTLRLRRSQHRAGSRLVPAHCGIAGRLPVTGPKIVDIHNKYLLFLLRVQWMLFTKILWNGLALVHRSNPPIYHIEIVPDKDQSDALCVRPVPAHSGTAGRPPFTGPKMYIHWVLLMENSDWRQYPIVTCRYNTWCQYWSGTSLIPWPPFQYPIRRLTVRSRKVSKPRDLYLELSDRSEIW